MARVVVLPDEHATPGLVIASAACREQYDLRALRVTVRDEVEWDVELLPRSESSQGAAPMDCESDEVPREDGRTSPSVAH